MSFVPHMSFVEAHKLQIGDKVDHRNVYGKFLTATITHKSKSGMFKIHYDDHISSTHDTECSYVNELYRFAKVGSISRRPAHRLKYIKTGSFVDINIAQHPGWRKAEVVTVCPLSGQIQVFICFAFALHIFMYNVYIYSYSYSYSYSYVPVYIHSLQITLANI